MAEHSPLPWKVHAKAPTLILTSSNEDVAVATPHGRKTPPRMEITCANAAYIVKACNAYPELVKALQNVQKRLQETNLLPTHEVGSVIGWCDDECRRALAKAGA